MLVVLAVLSTAATAALIVRAMTFSRVRFATSLRQVDAYGFTAHDRMGQNEEEHDGLATIVGRAFAARSESVDLEQVRRVLASAGVHGTSPERFVGYRVLATTLAPLGMAFSAVSLGMAPILGLGVVGLTALLGWRMPLVALERRAKHRHLLIDRELPELIDLLVVTVEAGLGFTQSLQMASDRLRDPLGDELRLALHQQQMGRSVEDALEALLERCDTPSMRAFVRSTLRGESLGVSIGTMLRNLAVDMRRIRRQRAEEQIQKAPIKMLFPLVFLIFPALLLAVLGPAGFTLKDAF